MFEVWLCKAFYPPFVFKGTFRLCSTVIKTAEITKYDLDNCFTWSNEEKSLIWQRLIYLEVNVDVLTDVMQYLIKGWRSLFQGINFGEFIWLFKKGEYTASL